MSSPLPVILVTGFLGSGKTTLLRRIAALHPQRRLLFLVNELAGADVDAHTLAEHGLRAHSVVGGSLFCDCKAGDFLRLVRDEILPAHAERPFDALIMETSGVADPAAIGSLLALYGMSQSLVLHRIVAVGPAARIPTLIENLPVAEAQIRCADFVVINKADLASSAQIEAARERIAALNPAASVKVATHCQIDFPLPEIPMEAPQGALTTCDANPYSSAEVTWPAERSVVEAEEFLRSLPPSILRVKGTIATPEGFWHVERTVDGTSVVRCPPGRERLVFLVHDDHENELADVVRSLPGVQRKPISACP